VLPPARAGDVLAALPARPLAIALVDGLFDTTPSVWHHELLAALDAGVAVFGGASMGALRAAELERHGVVGVGAIFRAYRDGALDDDAEVALLHGSAEHAFRPLTVPLVTVRAAADAARAERLLRPREARALVASAAAIHYTERTWPRVLAAAPLPEPARERLRAFLPRAPDPKAADARACIEAADAFVRARRAGAPAPPGRAACAVARPARAARARGLDPARPSRIPSGEILRALSRRPDAGALAADGLRRLVVAGLARSLGPPRRRTRRRARSPRGSPARACRAASATRSSPRAGSTRARRGGWRGARARGAAPRRRARGAGRAVMEEGPPRRGSRGLDRRGARRGRRARRERHGKAGA
jgi:hypothetical protein